MHRDLKPENVFIVVVGKSEIEHIAKLGDFGVAREVVSELMSKATKDIGSDGYMSPEQHKQQMYGPSSDIWAAGVILYEMIAGDHPFDSLKAIKKGPPKELPSYVPKNIRELLSNLLEKEPQKRMKAQEI